MKLQLDGDAVRLRLTEAELAGLLATGALDAAWHCPDGSTARCRLALHSDHDPGRCSGNLMDLQVSLPHAGFLAFAAARPRRDGFRFTCGALQVSVEIDVRDSRRARMHPPRGVQGGAR